MDKAGPLQHTTCVALLGQQEGASRRVARGDDMGGLGTEVQAPAVGPNVPGEGVQRDK